MSNKICPICNCIKRSDKYYQHIAVHKDELIAKCMPSHNVFCNDNQIPIIHVYDETSKLTHAVCLCCKKGSDIGNRRCSKPHTWTIEHASSECKKYWTEYSNLFEIKELPNDVKTLHSEIEKLKLDNERLRNIIKYKDQILIKYKPVIERHERHIRRRDKQTKENCFICNSSILCNVEKDGTIDYNNLFKHHATHIGNPRNHVSKDIYYKMIETRDPVIKHKHDDYYFCFCCKTVFNPKSNMEVIAKTRHKNNCEKIGFKQYITEAFVDISNNSENNEIIY